MSKTELLLISAQNDSIKNINVKGKIDNKQQKSKWRLCKERDETLDVANYHKILVGEGDPLGIVQEFEIRPYQ